MNGKTKSIAAKLRNLADFEQCPNLSGAVVSGQLRKEMLAMAAELSQADTAGVRCVVEKVGEWGQRVEPKSQTPIYQNTPETDNPPGFPMDHSWRELPVSAGDRVGIYLGGGFVAIVTAEEE